MGVLAWFSYHTEDELHRYNGSLNLAVPYVPSFNTKAAFETDENICKLNFAFDSDDTDITIIGTGEVRSINDCPQMPNRYSP